MTITERVQKQFFEADRPAVNRPTVIRLPPTVVVKYNVEDRVARARTLAQDDQAALRGKNRRTNLWTVEEHNRFLHGLELYPQGPWKCVAAVVGTKTTRQTMTHAQKYRQKIERHSRNDESFTRSAGSDESDPRTRSDENYAQAGSDEGYSHARNAEAYSRARSDENFSRGRTDDRYSYARSDENYARGRTDERYSYARSEETYSRVRTDERYPYARRDERNSYPLALLTETTAMHWAREQY